MASGGGRRVWSRARTMVCSSVPGGRARLPSVRAFRSVRFVGLGEPVFDREGPAVVVAPGAGDFQVAGGVAFEVEAEGAGEIGGCGVGGLDVGFDAVETEVGE